MKYLEVVSPGVGAQLIPMMALIRKLEISIEFPADGQRAREVISRSKAKATGKYPSWKLNRNVHYESLHECNAFKLLDACPEVSYFGEQPCRIRYVMNGEPRIHYPDIMVKLPTGKELLEVKTTEEAATEEVRERTAFMQRALPPLGYGYRILISDLLSRNPRLNNIEELLRFGRHPVSPTMREHIRQIFKVNGNSVPLGAFRVRGQVNYRLALYRLVLEGTLKIDVNEPLSDASPICWASASIGGASWA